MIDVMDVTKRFGSFAALDNVNVHVPDGAVYGLVGPNGAGKSTLIRHLTGAYRQDSGQILIDGQPVFENPQIKSRIAWIPDDLFYFPQARVCDMMHYYRGIYPKFDMARYQKLKDAFAISDRQTIRRMSKGMQKQAAFWLALCTSPDILILDEPVDGLDPVMRRQVWGLIMGDVEERGTTVLVSSHNLRELEDVCDHVGIIHHGKTVLERSLEELQGGTVKVQFVPADDWTLPPDLKVLHLSAVGRIQTAIIRGSADVVGAVFAAANPIFYDIVPLTLEEVFIYEMGGEDYAVKDLVI